MPLIPFPAWQPDIADYEGQTSKTISGVLPRADGYGPFPAWVLLSGALPGQCRGGIVAVKSDGALSIFAATATDLYLMNNTTFVFAKVSLAGGPYTSVPADQQWSFAQFRNQVIAVSSTNPPQVYDLITGGVSGNFAKLTGTQPVGTPVDPPIATYVTVVGSFVVLSGLISGPQIPSVDLAPYTIQWSGLNDPSNWTTGGLINSEDLQTLPDGGIVRGIAGGEFGLIMQDQAIRRMTYAPGSPVIFQITRIAQDKGIYAPYSLIRAGERVFFLTNQGFHVSEQGGYPQPIGKEKFDRTFLADLDRANLQLVIGAFDPRSSRVFWSYKSNAASQSTQYDKLICYDFLLDRATVIPMSGEYLLKAAQPGFTLEGLDAIAPTPLTITAAAGSVGGTSGEIRLTMSALSNATFNLGTVGAPSMSSIYVYGIVAGANACVEANNTSANPHWRYTVVSSTQIQLTGSTFVNPHTVTTGGRIGGSADAMTGTLDAFTTAVLTLELSQFDTSHSLGFFRGSSVEAVLETSEQGTDGARLNINNVRIITDAANVFASMSYRETQQALPRQTAEKAINAFGECPILLSTRYQRTRVRIPAGQMWASVIGVEPRGGTTGRY